MPLIDIRELTKSYDDSIVVDNVSFAVEEGEIFAILGPNGAGKTTTVESIAGLRTPDSGSIEVFGFDPLRDRAQVHKILGVQLQESRFQDRVKVREVVETFAAFYPDPVDVSELLERLGLSDKAGTRYAQLSGGQQQRLSIAVALVGRPRAVILDELTTGLDPQARRETWGLVEELRDRGVTVLLVTHFMEEAERLADRLALIDQGRLVALDTPQGLIDSVGLEQHVRFTTSEAVDDEWLRSLPEVTGVSRDNGEIVVTGTGTTAVLDRLVVGRPRDHPRTIPGRSDDARRRLRRHHRATPGTGRRRGRAMTAFSALTQTQFRVFLREPLAVFFGLVFPSVLLVVIGLAYPGATDPDPFFDGRSLVEVYAPTAIVLGLTTMAIFLLPVALGGDRERGILRRLSTTPAHPRTLVTAHLAVQLVVVTLATVAAVLIGTVAFPISLPENLIWFIVSFALGACSLLAIGLLIGAVVPTANTGQGIGMLLYFPLLFFAGVYVPIEVMPDTIRTISTYTPAGAAVQALADSWTGDTPQTSSLLVMLVYGVVAGTLAIRLFRWQ